MAKERKDYFTEFNEKKHFRSKVDWNKVKKLKDEDFIWEILEPISIMIRDLDHEEERVKRLSPGQKALHFFWYLDAQVTNGGFIQFYFNGYEAYLPSLKKGLEVIGYKKLLSVVTKSEELYDKHIKEFKGRRTAKLLSSLYSKLPEFGKLDDWYYSNEKEHYAFFDKYIRKNIDDFIVRK